LNMSSTTTTDKDYVRIDKFDGKPETYTRWQATFMAILENKNIPEVLAHVYHATSITPKDDDEFKDENRVVIPKKLKVKEQNSRAYGLFLTSMAKDMEEAKLSFDTVLMGRNASLGYTRGNFKTAWLDLQELMMPRNQATLLMSREEYQTLKMKHNESPAVFMTKLQEIKGQMKDQGGRDIPEEEFLMDILSKLPNAKNRNSDPPYGIARALIERDMSDPTNTVNYLSVQRELSNRYRYLQSL